MRRLRPSLVTSTWRTLGGKATGFGNRTAWLRLVVKTVERATWTFRIGISQRDIRISCRLVNTDWRKLLCILARPRIFRCEAVIKHMKTDGQRVRLQPRSSSPG